eukprot:Protomagalhaensia_wolfi_Nauph_80__893@NODE_1514_length_1492_cov_1006_576738_g1174_i0_p1_GENE_NODE_1514_length_1492_cov_1006_576738_g1174_i0NODE_1514_length_1492_cov_1006_576738_g1174_i0_p1_ORF_typecomplete_len212_score37_89Trehalose_PPase/PF02358_16/9_3e11Hydrolase_3/PF08282_12/0_0026Hydrolase_3/PF08282_12/2_8e03DUF3689/PF12463_8/0_049PHD_Oberon/PF07227_11/4_3e02PHD_Oberon/PF07227_11/1_3_NODE_1514_length_1492_cov_1006_576738_g1174_i06621297
MKLRGVNKGTAVEHVMLSVKSLFGDPQFILCIGDDRSDEAMFAIVNGVEKGDSMCHHHHHHHSSSEGAARPASSPPTSMHKHANLASVISGDGNESEASSGLAVYTVTVGKKPSEAKYFCTDTDEVSDLLNILKQQTTHSELRFDPQSLVEGILRASSSREDQSPFDHDIMGLGKQHEFSLNSIGGVSPTEDPPMGGPNSTSWPGSLLLQL